MIGGITGIAPGQTLVYSFTFYTVMCFGKPISAFRSYVEKKRKEKTTPLGVSLMRSQVLYRAAWVICMLCDTRMS